VPILIRTLRGFDTALRVVNRLLGAGRPASGPADPQVETLIARAEEARRARRRAEAESLFQQAIQRDRNHPGALRGQRDLAVESGRWQDALGPGRRLVALASASEYPREAEWLAVIHYELGRSRMAAGKPEQAVTHFRDAIRVDRRFLPAPIALGDAWEAAGDRRAALRVWERAVEVMPVLPILTRLEQAYREEGRPARMIECYERAVERAPDDLALAIALGRVYYELEMLDEAADHFEKLEVRASDTPAVHAFLGAIFERRGQWREAFDEYRRGVQLALKFGPPHHCSVCGVGAATWRDRCPSCGRWNTLRP
jgi:lipopolysaccharide biosynthesis regulator YciM